MDSIDQSVKTKYLLVSHHPKDRSISPCTSVYNVFLSPKAVYPHSNYIFVHSPPEKFKQQLVEKTDNENITILFNGCCSLLSDNAIYALEYAKKTNRTKTLVASTKISRQIVRQVSEKTLTS